LLEDTNPSSLTRDGNKTVGFSEREIKTPVGPNLNPIGKHRPPSGQRKTASTLNQNLDILIDKPDKPASLTRLNSTKAQSSVKELPKMKPMMRKQDGVRTA